MTWRAKNQKVPQPPMRAQSRDQEHHSFWPGAAGALLGLGLLVCGATHTTRIDTAEAGAAREHQLIKAFAHGGVRIAPPPSAPDLASFDDPALAAAALEKFEKQEAGAPRIKYVVHTTAVDPCPT